MKQQKNKHCAPLEGLKVLDFSTLLPGPYATMLLADLGAEVLRIESPSRPDLLRGFPPLVDDSASLSAAHATINRNKRSLAIDLKSPKAKEVIHRLLQQYDIVIEQFRPGVMDRLGLGYQNLSQQCEDIIYCSITGYGQTGPLKQRAGHDINYLALSGLASYSGNRSHGPCLSGTQIADIAGGSHHAVMSILAAVYHRQRTGEGSYIDISMTDCSFALNAISGANALALNSSPEIESELLNGGSYYDYYRTADNRFLSVGSLEPQFAEQFFIKIGHKEWMDRILQDDQQEKLKEDIAKIIASKTQKEWLAVFQSVDACIEPVLNFTEAADSELIQSREMITSIDGGIKQINTPFRFNRKKPLSFSRGASLGEHNHTVLSELGFSAEEIEEICETQVVPH
ncbi:CaiB/BaiF CoA transferase family protein [Microbulbifer sp. JMSA004]|uniref:CaiB/BaiF CoA transferase family protein n=1 Tax=unclassified Microbulbifer TaxID=2619833 RepID=UPI0024AD1837|nr:CaiB/BaiF CoA-transferase family protein [Microbulbifer sp. VAAF005]WHI45223.1 CaiB/BaiF CoA-transferase family protein [Microbulbifer sp. VAAF005]